MMMQGTRSVGWREVVLAAVLALAAPAALRANECEPVAGEYYNIRVEAEIPKAQIDRSHDRRSLRLLSGQLGKSVIGAHQHGTRLDMVHEFGYHPKGDGLCYWLRRVEVTLIYDAPIVYVAKEYPPGGCNDRAIQQHEAKHVQVAQSHIRLYKDDFHKVLSSLNLPRPNRPHYAPDPESAKADVVARTAALVEPVFARLKDAMGKAQARIDSEREYREVQRRCPNW